MKVAGNFNYTTNDDFRAVELPYGDSTFSMVLMVPNSGKTVNDPLKNLGLEVAFSGEADFSRIIPDMSLYISRVIHQTFIDVQEEGTEAAAATIVEIRWESSGNDPIPIMFKADKPFLYVIKENSTSAIMFMGKVGKPEYE